MGIVREPIDDYARTLIAIARTNGDIGPLMSQLFIAHNTETQAKVITRAMQIEPRLRLKGEHRYRSATIDENYIPEEEEDLDEGCVALILYSLVCVLIGILVGQGYDVIELVERLVEYIRE